MLIKGLLHTQWMAVSSVGTLWITGGEQTLNIDRDLLFCRECYSTERDGGGKTAGLSFFETLQRNKQAFLFWTETLHISREQKRGDEVCTGRGGGAESVDVDKKVLQVDGHGINNILTSNQQPLQPIQYSTSSNWIKHNFTWFDCSNLTKTIKVSVHCFYCSQSIILSLFLTSTWTHIGVPSLWLSW